MRKRPIKLIMLFTALLSVFFLVGIFSGCEKLVSVTSVEMKEGQQEITVEVGKFEFSDYTIVINYDDGSSTEEELKEEYIPTEYQMQLYSEGTHEILVKAHMRECTFTLNVLRHSFSEDIVLNNITAPYTGEPYSACVEGVLPSGTKITYSNGNSFTNVGTYECYAILTCEGYITKYLQCEVKITPIDYDMSGVSFEEKYEYDYDGKSKSVSLKGDLPKGVTVSYTIDGESGNSAINAKDYTVIAHFLSNDPNYNPIEPMSTVLKIKKATVSTEEVGENFKTVVGGGVEYDGTAHTVVYNKKLPSGVNSATVEYYDKNGERILNMVNAGEYTVKIILTGTDEENHALSCYYYTEPYIISKKLIVSNNIYFDNDEVFYDGQPHTLTVTGEHIEGLSIVYEVEGTTETEFTEVGTYNFKATIPEDDNYEYEEVVREATLTIVAIKSGYGDITDSKVIRETYNGEEFGWDFSFIPNCLEYTYVLKNSKGEVVEHPITVDYYVYTVNFSNTNNYNDVPDSCEYYLEITPATMEIPESYSKERAFEYTGDEKEYPSSTPSNDITVTVEYVGRDSLPVEIGTYDIKLTFKKDNYYDVVKNTKLVINNAIIYDNINFQTNYSGLINGSKPYNDGNPIDFSEYENKVFNAKRIARNDEIPEGLYYYGENGSDIPVKVSLEYYKKGSNEQLENITEVGEYEINFVYSFVVATETGYVKYNGEKVNFTVVKADKTLVCGVDYNVGVKGANGVFTKTNTSEYTGLKPQIDIEPLNDKVGKTADKEFSFNLGSSKAYVVKNSSGEISDLITPGTYTVSFEVLSYHYNVTAEVTWEVTHIDLDNYDFVAYFDYPTGWAEECKTYFPIIEVNGSRVYADFDIDYQQTVTGNGISPDLTIKYEIVFSMWGSEYNYSGYNTLVGTWKRVNDATHRIDTFRITGFAGMGPGAYYFKFTITNGLGEERVYYGDLPEESKALDKAVVTDSKYCALRVEPENFKPSYYGE